MFNYSNNSKELINKNFKFLNNISKHNYKNNFLLDNLIGDLYKILISLVPDRIAVVASINSKDSFEYFLDYSIEDIRLILKKNNNNWSLRYKVYPSYLDAKNKLDKNSNTFGTDIIIINLKDFYEKNVKKYYN